MSHRNTHVAACVAALTTFACVTAAAAPKVDLSMLSPAQQQHLAKSQAKRQQPTPQYNYDIRPPVLKSFQLSGDVNAGLAIAQQVVTLTATDNLSGLRQVNVRVQSESGQYFSGYWNASYPQTSNRVQIAIDMSQATVNGTWHLDYVSLLDANDNLASYDATELAAMGTTEFRVSRAAGDSLAPSVLPGGINLTPTVSLSRPPAGMLPGNAPRVGVQMKFRDEGVAGIDIAYATFCGDWDCFSVSGRVSPRGIRQATLTLGGSVWEYFSAGSYRLNQIEVTDKSGNSRYYYDWDTDLSSFIDNPVIVITP